MGRADMLYLVGHARYHRPSVAFGLLLPPVDWQMSVTLLARLSLWSYGSAALVILFDTGAPVLRKGHVVAGGERCMFDIYRGCALVVNDFTSLSTPSSQSHSTFTTYLHCLPSFSNVLNIYIHSSN